MKLIVAIVLAGAVAAAAAMSLPRRGTQPFAAENPPKNMPLLIIDESAGDWVVDRFAGNSTAGPKFFQGPAREVGGLGRPGGVAPLPDGRVYFAAAGSVLEVSPDGTLRRVIGGGAGNVEGAADQVCGGRPIWNPKEKALYVTGPNCLRRVIVKDDGSWHLELVAGVPHKQGSADGPAKTATFTNLRNLVINSRGTVYVLDGHRRLRRIKDGEVKTLHPNFRGGKRIDGPLAQASFNIIGLGGGICAGEDDDTLYVADHWNFCARKIDLKTMTVTTVACMPKPKWKPKNQRNALERRFNKNADGPALIYASCNSGCAYACWDPVHKTLWLGGPDESRFRWLRKDGWVKTVIGARGKGKNAWPKDALGVPAADVKLVWNSVVAVDHLGRAYLAASSSRTGLWRAYNSKEIKP